MNNNPKGINQYTKGGGTGRGTTKSRLAKVKRHADRILSHGYDRAEATGIAKALKVNPHYKKADLAYARNMARYDKLRAKFGGKSKK